MADVKPQVPIGVALPTIPPRAFGSPPVDPPPGFPDMPRASLLEQAVWSVEQQTVAPVGLIQVALDVNREGAAATRQRALDMVTAEYTAFLDDDDLWYSHHLETHWNLLREHDADVAYSWFDGNRPFPASTHRGKPWDPADPHHITMGITVRTALAKRVGFRAEMATPECGNEDWFFIKGLNDLGAKFVGTSEVTFHYRLHGTNTSGLPARW
jgi:glycosyltransferase involved in cell wall biosynthesis